MCYTSHPPVEAAPDAWVFFAQGHTEGLSQYQLFRHARCLALTPPVGVAALKVVGTQAVVEVPAGGVYPAADSAAHDRAS